MCIKRQKALSEKLRPFSFTTICLITVDALREKKKTGRHFKSVQNIFCLVLKSSSFNCNIDNILSYIVFSFSFLPRSVVAEAIVDLGGAVGNMETPVVYYEF